MLNLPGCPMLPGGDSGGTAVYWAEVGKPLRNCYTLPGFDFAYGLYIPRTDGGVPEAIGHWNTVNQNRTDLVQKMPRDFITMNRGALKAGYTTAREYNLYYKDKDIRRKEEECTRLKKGPIKLPADMTFGIPARPPTPIFDILQHRYKELWMEQQRALTVAQRVETKKLQKGKPRETHTTLLRKNPQPTKKESFWHLPRLEKKQHPREEEQLVLHSLCRFFVLLSHYVNLEGLQI
nr:cilia- and flagella-associated protein 77 isoform X1 [Columba livia]